MKKLSVELTHCYGIRHLSATFDFSATPAYSIYAPNGAMKSSFARTFKDVETGAVSMDRVFPSRVCERAIVDETGAALPSTAVFVVSPYDEEFGHTEKTSTLLVDNKLRQEYEKLHKGIEEAEEVFLKAMKEESSSKKNLKREISLAFTPSSDSFYTALTRVFDEVAEQKDTPWVGIEYDVIFDDKVLQVLGQKDFGLVINDYVEKYNALLEASTYFKRGTFNYYNAATIAKSLADNGFFDAKHSVRLNADTVIEINNPKQLEQIIQQEKDAITNDGVLKAKFKELEKLLEKNMQCRDFVTYLDKRPDVVGKLNNVAVLKEEVWKSYFKQRFDVFSDLVGKYKAAQKRRKEIEVAAAKQRTQWEEVIEIFNDRFFVPFKLIAQNRTQVILGNEPVLNLGFVFEDGGAQAPVEKSMLMQVLSTGEKKALYVLNIIFEVEARKKAGADTLFVFDDIADSFDYRNKYAIIQYLHDIAEDPHFKQVLLTHNFDFFRTVQSRFVGYKYCLMASKSAAGLTLEPAAGIKNVFVNDWKKHFFDDRKKKIASIPFMRNLIEFTKGENDADYTKLTSLLHWREDSSAITMGDLDQIYTSLFGGAGSPSYDVTEKVLNVISVEAGECLKASDGINFENKIVLAIATRLAAEQYMASKISELGFLAGIASNQTQALLRRFRMEFPSDVAAINTLCRVVLMTPENIHLNSFMYEPILDMSDEHLRKLYQDVLDLR